MYVATLLFLITILVFLIDLQYLQARLILRITHPVELWLARMYAWTFHRDPRAYKIWKARYQWMRRYRCKLRAIDMPNRPRRA